MGRYANRLKWKKFVDKVNDFIDSGGQGGGAEGDGKINTFKEMVNAFSEMDEDEKIGGFIDERVNETVEDAVSDAIDNESATDEDIEHLFH